VKDGQASRTAEYVALFRAIESSLPAKRRLFEDSVAKEFLGARFGLLATLCRVPGAADLIAGYIDRRWAGARSSAVVILGAGFDARAYRLPGLSDVAVFEVDHPATLAKKRSVLRRASLDAPSRVRSVGIDFRSADLAPVMDAAGYSTQARTFILCEGVTNYLTEAAVDTTLRWCARAAAGSQLLFTYVHRAVLDDPGSFAGTERLFATLKKAGEQWTFGLEPGELAGFLEKRGLELEHDIGSSEYRARYLPQVTRIMRGYEFYRIAIARVP
jgi:methyltransferase (TIGR00027 family)